MKVRESGMPEEAIGASFVDAPRILTQLGFDEPSADVVEFGCGYGTFTIAAAARTRGTVFAFDLEPEMLELTKRKARESQLQNVRPLLRDFLRVTAALPLRSCRPKAWGEESMNFLNRVTSTRAPAALLLIRLSVKAAFLSALFTRLVAIPLLTVMPVALAAASRDSVSWPNDA